MVYTQMLFALAFDKLVFGTTPGMLSIVGSTLILGSAIYVAVRKEDTKIQATANTSEHVTDEERALVDGADDSDSDSEDRTSYVQEIPLRIIRV
jgi:hypothetical protein